MENATPTTQQDRPPLSRRDFLGKVGLGAAAAATNVIVTPKLAAALGTTTGTRRQTVAVFGGGIAGLTAAHELIERGFDVTVYERRAWGGKARSMDVPGSATGGRRPLPGEHSFRVFFGFYQNLPDTMRRIPFGSNPGGVFDNLVQAPNVLLARIGQRDLTVPLGGIDPTGFTPAAVRETVLGLALQADIPPQAAAHFADRMVVYFSSCDARRNGQWENISWADFINSEQYRGDYRRVFSELIAHLLWASSSDVTSTNIVGKTVEWVVYNTLGRNSNGPPIRILNLPSNEAFIDPWMALLRRHGVGLRLNHAVEGFKLRDGRVVGATVRGPAGLQAVTADWYVCALPFQRARQLWSRAILAADPQLARLSNLQSGQGNGMKFFLRRQDPITKGHVFYSDAPWPMASISQTQFWPVDFAATYGDGTVLESLSAVWVDFDKPGILYGKSALDCTPNELAREVWEQMKQHFDTNDQPLRDEDLHSWFIDPGLIPRPGGGFDNEDPVTLATVGALPNRPAAGTAIPNFILAGDYVLGEWETGNMEVANETGRRAANAILERSGSRESPARVFPTYRPPEWEPLKRIDEARYRAGLPNQFDTPLLDVLTTPLLGAL